MFFHALTFAGSRGCCLNKRLIGLLLHDYTKPHFFQCQDRYWVILCVLCRLLDFSKQRFLSKKSFRNTINVKGFGFRSGPILSVLILVRVANF